MRAWAERSWFVIRAKRFLLGCLPNVSVFSIEPLNSLFAEWGSTKTGEQDGLIGTAMNCVLQVPKFLPQEQRFDIRVLVSSCASYINRKLFVSCIELLWFLIKELEFSVTRYIPKVRYLKFL